MAYFNGPFVADPPVLPQRPYGLFDVALGPMDFPVPGAVGGGVMYQPDACEDDVFLVAMNCPPITGTKSFSAIEAVVSGGPFTVMTSYTCGSIGYTFAEAERRVRARLSLREQRGVEKRLWQGSTGTLGTIPGLFASATTIGAAGCVTEAVEMLEQQLADAGTLDGIIHARPGMAAHFSSSHLYGAPQGRVKRTEYGTRISFGQGYAGTGPTGQAVDATTEWVYATGRVLIWGGEVFVPPAGQVLNRSTNQLSLVAERPFAVAVECGIWAVSVTRTCTTAGGG